MLVNVKKSHVFVRVCVCMHMRVDDGGETEKNLGYDCIHPLRWERLPTAILPKKIAKWCIWVSSFVFSLPKSKFRL